MSLGTGRKIATGWFHPPEDQLLAVNWSQIATLKQRSLLL
jgi:hypothetical protein